MPCDDSINGATHQHSRDLTHSIVHHVVLEKQDMVKAGSSIRIEPNYPDAAQDDDLQQLQQQHFTAAQSTQTVVTLHIAGGKNPVRLLFETSKLINFGNLAKVLGMVPFNLLSLSHNCCRFTRLPIPLGIVPVREHPERLILCNVVDVFPMELGIVPVKPGFRSIQISRMEGMSSMKSRDPVISESSQ